MDFIGAMSWQHWALTALVIAIGITIGMAFPGVVKWICEGIAFVVIWLAKLIKKSLVSLPLKAKGFVVLILLVFLLFILFWFGDVKVFPTIAHSSAKTVSPQVTSAPVPIMVPVPQAVTVPTSAVTPVAAPVAPATSASVVPTSSATVTPAPPTPTASASAAKSVEAKVCTPVPPGFTASKNAKSLGLNEC